MTAQSKAALSVLFAILRLASLASAVKYSL
jgi:hypothetical protein